MPKMPDISAMTLDELTELASIVGIRIAELKQARIDELRAKRAELDAELARMMGTPAKAPKLPAGLNEGRKRASPRVQFRLPSGVGYSGRGAIPRVFREAGVTDRAGLEQYRVSD